MLERLGGFLVQINKEKILLFFFFLLGVSINAASPQVISEFRSGKDGEMKWQANKEERSG